MRGRHGCGLAGYGVAGADNSVMPIGNSRYCGVKTPHGQVWRGTSWQGTPRRGKGYNVAASIFAEGAFRYRVPRGSARRGLARSGRARHGLIQRSATSQEVVERCESITRHSSVRLGMAGHGVVRSGMAGAAGQRNGLSLRGHYGAKALSGKALLGAAGHGRLGRGRARAVIRTGSPAYLVTT